MKQPQFFTSRVIRLCPAYGFSIVFTTGVLVTLPGVWDRQKLREILLDFTMLQPGSGVSNVDGVYWTLWSELRFHLLFMAVVVTGLTYRKVVLFCCFWGAAAMIAPAARFRPLTLVVDPEGAWYFIAGLALSPAGARVSCSSPCSCWSWPRSRWARPTTSAGNGSPRPVR
ncbi:hypothetical protein [Streptomyces sp. NPDC101776]|uniref:hypothetical protein n=1 Tax=Streptomyces sp. NPDC101776 TaxID=3366146 RepID=UPI0037F60AB4